MIIGGEGGRGFRALAAAAAAAALNIPYTDKLKQKNETNDLHPEGACSYFHAKATMAYRKKKRSGSPPPVGADNLAFWTRVTAVVLLSICR